MTTRRLALRLSCLLLATGLGCAPMRADVHSHDPRFPASAANGVSFNHVKITDAFWLVRIQTTQRTTLPELFDLAETQGKLDNFRIVAGRKKGAYRPYNAPDSDVYKLIESAAYSLVSSPDPTLQKRVESIVADIVAAQQVNGYLNTQFTLDANDPAAPKDNPKFLNTFGFGKQFRWSSTAENWPFGYSQLYCAGHLIEAGVAWYRATGQRTLLDAAIRNADHITSVFDDAKIRKYADHPEVEIGLMKLYEVTGNAKYVTLADAFARYCEFSRPPDIDRAANRKPLQDQREAIGHAVRTAYVYAGAAAVTRVQDQSDLRTALLALWENVVSSKMYIHGGTGNGTKAEQHGHNFDLPISATYSETCAAVAEAQFSHELNLLTGDAKFADVVELEFWNNALAGISLDGRTFFYSNKLNLGTSDRKDQHSGVRKSYLFCCPSKVPMLLTGIGRWIYATDADGLIVNQLVGSEVTTTFHGETVTLTMQTFLPWDGRTELTLSKVPAGEMAIAIRIPAWMRSTGPVPAGPYRFAGESPRWSMLVNGQIVDSKADNDGYVTLRRVWNPGDVVSIESTMPIRRVYTDEKIAANRGRVALMRGPLLYCLEGVDNSFDVNDAELPRDAAISYTFRPELLGGVGTLTGSMKTRDGKPVSFTAIAYFAWENRGVHALSTLFIEDRSKLHKDAGPTTNEMNIDG